MCAASFAVEVKMQISSKDREIFFKELEFENLKFKPPYPILIDIALSPWTIVNSGKMFIKWKRVQRTVQHNVLQLGWNSVLLFLTG
jgi:hypothetical protein